MNEFDPRAALEAALKALNAATTELMSRFRPPPEHALNVWTKGPGALVTDADLASDRAIAAILSDSGVTDHIRSEESVHGASGGNSLKWLVDPLCGTSPFSTGMGHWGINIALVSDRRIEVAALAIPTLGETLSAVADLGVARNGARYTPQPPPTGRLSDVMVGLEIDAGPRWAALSQSELHWTARVGQFTSFASAAYPLGQVILGRLHGVVFYEITNEHLAAGAGVARELGISVTDREGRALDWSSEAPNDVVVAGWPDIHHELLDALAKG